MSGLAPSSRIPAVILAAGASTRLGQPKQLVRLAGESLLRRTLRLALQAGCAPVFVVLGCEAARMEPELDGLDAIAVINPSWADGMGSSLRSGMQAVSQLSPPPKSVLLLVCDQPRLSLEHLHRLLHQHRTGSFPVTASAYNEGAGVPALFAASLFPELLALSADRGARDVIRSHPGLTQTVPWRDGAFDLDSPEDLQEMIRP